MGLRLTKGWKNFFERFFLSVQDSPVVPGNGGREAPLQHNEAVFPAHLLQKGRIQRLGAIPEGAALVEA